MLGRRSLDPDLVPLNLDLERRVRTNRKLGLDTMAENNENNNNMNENENNNMNENGERNIVVPPQLAPLQSHLIPTTYSVPSCISLPEITASHYVIPLNTIASLPIFYGKPNEDPYLHISEFEAVSSMIRIQNFPTDALRLFLFQFSLKDNAKHWLGTLPPNSITSWAEMSAAFLKKHFPIGKTLQSRLEITSFRQAENEQFHEAWERFGDVIRRCPHHDIPKWQLVQSFYNGLLAQNRIMVDTSSGGSIMCQNEEDAWVLFEKMSEASRYQASFERKERSGPINSVRPRGMYEVKPTCDLNMKMEALTEKVDRLLTLGPSSTTCPLFKGMSLLQPTHFRRWPAAPHSDFVQEQVNVAQGYSNPRSQIFILLAILGLTTNHHISTKLPASISKIFPRF